MVLDKEGEPRHGVLTWRGLWVKAQVHIDAAKVSTRGSLGLCSVVQYVGHAISSLEGQNAE